MASSGSIAIFLLVSGIIHRQGSGQIILDGGDKMTKVKFQSDNMNLGHPQSSLSFNQRPTQFIAASSEPTQTTAHSRGALIMPANNQVQAGNFHLAANPALIRTYVHQQHHLGSGVSSTNDQQLNKHTSQLPAQTGSPDNGINGNQQIMNNETLLIEQPTNNSLLRGISQSDLELALRQANSDENVFQPSSAVPALGHGYDQWPPARPSSPISTTEPSYSNLKEEEQWENKVQQHHQSTSIGKNPTNNIEIAHTTDLPTKPSSVDDHTKQRDVHQPIEPIPGSVGQSNQVELGNQIIYEGPATAPPAGEYYFSSAERAPNHERASSNIWWSLGFGHEFDRANNLTRDDYLDYCAKSEILISNKQRLLCKSHPKIMSIVAKGLRMAIDECQSRFTSNRWNCSLVLHESLSKDQLATSRAQVFGEVMNHPNRERSFLNAIISAGLAQSMTKACSQGELPEECSCDKRIKSKNSKGKIEWIACSDDIDFGARFSRDFTDSGADNDSDTTSMINTHNYEVGRRVFKSATDITCSCLNGEIGSCQTKRCWKHLGPFTDIGDELMKRYESATHVQPSNKDPHKLRPVRRGVRRPKRKDLVYIDESPDYCSADSRLGVLGTQNRRCNSTSSGPDSCSLLCCGRGYQVVIEEIEEECNCKFVWCCQVKCDKCKRQVINDVCN